MSRSDPIVPPPTAPAAEVESDPAWVAPLLEAAHIFVLRLDEANCVVQANTGAERFFGPLVHAPRAYLCRDTRDYRNTPSLFITQTPDLPPQGGDAGSAILLASVKRKTPQECLIRHGNGRQRRALVSALRPTVDGRGRITTLLLGLPVSRRNRIESDLRESQARFERLASATFEAIVMIEDGVILDANETFRGMFGYAAEELTGMRTTDCVAPDHRAEFIERVRQPVQEAYETVALRKTGETFAAEIRSRSVPFQGRQARIAAVRDISDAKRDRERLFATNAELQRLAITDGLTGLDNRRAFDAHLEREINNASRYGPPLSLVVMDVDRFKQYNDAFGHTEGDTALKRIADVLVAQARKTDFPARYGGEEFAIVLSNTPLDNARLFAERCRQAIAGNHWPHRRVTASFGIAAWTPAMDSPRDLIHAADQALYEAKRQGRDRVHCAGD